MKFGMTDVPRDEAVRRKRKFAEPMYQNGRFA
jgi:hypothetical protein